MPHATEYPDTLWSRLRDLQAPAAVTALGVALIGDHGGHDWLYSAGILTAAVVLMATPVVVHLEHLADLRWERQQHGDRVDVAERQ